MAQNGTIKAQSNSIWTMILRLRQLTAHTLILQATLFEVLEREDLEQLNDLANDERSYGSQNANLLVQLRRVLAIRRRIDDDGGTRPVYLAPTADQLDNNADSAEVGKSHGLNFKIKKYLNDLESAGQFKVIEDLKECAYCHQVVKEPYITACLHIYCKQCLEEKQQDYAEDGNEKAPCSVCGTIFAHSEPCTEDLFASTASATRAGRSKSSRRKKGTTSKAGATEGASDEEWTDKRGALLPSAKTIAIKAQVLNWLAEDPSVKIIVFTQWLPMVEIIVKMCMMEEWGYCTYTGEMSQKSRADTIDEFKVDPKLTIMVASLKCGGLGLNLTMASKVICVDPWWNNAIEQQAFCRVYRIGQEKETSMLNLIVANSIDERMECIKADKQINIDAVVDDNEARKKLTTNDLLRLFGNVQKNKNGTLRVVADDEEGDEQEQAVVNEE